MKILKQWLRRQIRNQAKRSATVRSWYRRLYQPDGSDWADLLRSANLFHRIGEHCSIQTDVNITDPAYVRLGNNVRLSGCTLFGHDGSINMLNRAYGDKLDSVGKIDIGDDVFIGYGAIVMPDVSIGSRVIIGAGALVTRDIPANSLAVGVPAKVIRTLDEHVELLRERTRHYPWHALIEQRSASYDPAVQAQLDAARIAWFFPEDKT